MKKLVSILAPLFLLSCSNMQEPVLEKEWRVNEDTGKMEETDVYSTTIYTTEDKDLPKLKLPTEKKGK